MDTIFKMIYFRDDLSRDDKGSLFQEAQKFLNKKARQKRMQKLNDIDKICHVKKKGGSTDGTDKQDEKNNTALRK